ncbi:transcriptional regulator, LacI family [Phenylobacterium zucineum HLK1]|uniref:Transcriptional regulator, LacI family n=1 Tax=Phenylobacterium zucineum (strain HLK1) TaxID=450851 RepID=B4RGF9_PHEZH|nr:LacI family DNA-binding transcriptional regulator [Phenylobacterium zucineum]ACG78865.1 transcriptional regulator, LacI family [Phenylobacterium zucineum HLK1]
MKKAPRAPDDALETPRRRPTINDIARLAGVSKKTVSRVINASPFVRSDTRDRIQAVIAELGYAPDPQARGLAYGRSFLIGLVYDNPNPQYVVNMQLGLLDGMKGSGFELVVHPCDRESPTFLEDLRAFIERQRLFGVVLTPSVSEDERAAKLMSDIGCAYVRVASVSLDTPEHMIETRDRLGGREAARHLAELGHTRIGFISGPASFRSSHERRSGFEEALNEHGLTLSRTYVAEGAYTFDSGVERGRELLAIEPRPTAIFAANDEMAAGVLQAARQAGLRIPEDLSVVGFDDFQIASRLWPALTTVRTPTREIGRLAVERLLGRDDDVRDPKNRLPSLVVRDSTAPLKG